MKGVSFSAVAEMAKGRWQDVLGSLGVEGALLTDRHSACPARANCPGNDEKSGDGGSRRFRFDDHEGRGSWICSGSFSGDGFDLLGHVHGWSKGRCLREVAAAVGLDVGDPSREVSRQKDDGVASAPKLERGPKRKPFDIFALRYFAEGLREVVDRKWLASRSPVPPEWGARSGLGRDFLAHLYQPGEAVLIFTEFWSQGDFAFRDAKTYRLGDRPGVKAVHSELPVGGKEGVWFLTNPVSGKWEPMDGGKVGRRHGGCVTAWRYAVLESDEAPSDLWLRALVQLDLRVAAIYTSGGRSIHALVRVDARNKGEFDICRDMLVASLCKLGADGGALSGVRLSRLPGCRRGEAGVQELYYLNPDPGWERIAELPVVR